MNREELLTKLAMELEEWPDSLLAARSLGYRSMWKWKIDEWDFYLISIDMKHQIRKEHWLDRRIELINEPDDAGAPPQAKYKLQGPTGQWYWAWGSEPVAIFVHSTGFEGWNVDSMCSDKATKGECPAGHDWRKTLREVNRMTTTAHEDQYSPEPHGITGVKHRVKIRESGTCIDGTQCGTFAEMAYCPDCPEAPDKFDAEFDARQLAQQLREAMQNNANGILNAAAQHMQDRASTYDKPQGERSMAATVNAFRATTGIGLTEEQGWHFMALLKLVRSQQGDLRLDSYEDGAAYIALAGEAAAKHR